jgi:hypothetical protein
MSFCSEVRTAARLSLNSEAFLLTAARLKDGTNRDEPTGARWVEWLKRAKDGSISQREAAEKMGVSDRWVRTLLKRMSKQGDAVVVHGLRGRPSNRKLSAETQRKALQLLKQPDWHDFGPTFASQQLAKRHGSKSAMRRYGSG